MRILEARSILGIAVGDFFPQTQDMEGSAFHQSISSNAPNTRFSDRFYWDYNLGMNVAWELDFWGKFRRLIESSKQVLFATAADYEQVRILLIADIASTYMGIRTLQERIDIIKSNIKVQERALEIAQVRWEVGAVTELDVQQAKAFLENTRTNLPLLQSELRAAHNALAVLLGATPECLSPCFYGEGVVPETSENVMVTVPCELLKNRPDVRASLYRLAAQSELIGVAEADLLPHISISGFVGFQSSGNNIFIASGSGGTLLSPSSFSATYGPSFSWPIFNYGRLTYRVRAEYARFYEFLFSYQNLSLNAYREVEDSIYAYLKNKEALESLGSGVEAALRSTALATAQYVDGFADYTRVLNSQQEQLLQQERYVITKGDSAQSLISLYRSLGGGWQP